MSMFEGILTNRSQNTLGQITVKDGTSNTLLFGEAIIGNEPNIPSQPDVRHFEQCWMGAGSLPTIGGLHRTKEVPWWAFGSRHPNLVMFCFADGSARGITKGFGIYATSVPPYDSRWYLFQQLGGMNDGLNADTSSILE
jgi:prepilin-type processing-associated H-X9-DG protein